MADVHTGTSPLNRTRHINSEYRRMELPESHPAGVDLRSSLHHLPLPTLILLVHDDIASSFSSAPAPLLSPSPFRCVSACVPLSCRLLIPETHQTRHNIHPTTTTPLSSLIHTTPAPPARAALPFCHNPQAQGSLSWDQPTTTPWLAPQLINLTAIFAATPEEDTSPSHPRRPDALTSFQSHLTRISTSLRLRNRKMPNENPPACPERQEESYRRQTALNSSTVGHPQVGRKQPQRIRKRIHP